MMFIFFRADLHESFLECNVLAAMTVNIHVSGTIYEIREYFIKTINCTLSTILAVIIIINQIYIHYDVIINEIVNFGAL